MAYQDQPMTEAEWQAFDDARTLARAETIKADKGRFNKASTAAKRILAEEKEETKAMAKVAGKKTTETNPDKTNDTIAGLNIFKKI